MATNLLAMPLVEITVETGNNEDWIDSLKYLVDEDDPDTQLDIRGIDFFMEIRRNVGEHEVLISASTDDDRLAVGLSPDYGFLLIAVPLDAMKQVTGGDYVGQIVGQDELNTRVVAYITLTIIEGVTTLPLA